MPIPTAFHHVLAPLCESFAWKEWAGYYAPKHFENNSEREYQAFRHSVGLIDLMPLYKYKISGVDAKAFLNFALVKDISKLRKNRVTYTCWCDDNGHVIDDGTIMCLDEKTYYLTAAIPSFAWFKNLILDFDVSIEDISEQYAILGTQGPMSRTLLENLELSASAKLKFFRFCDETLEGCEILVSRTGYTGDLGYELWIKPQDVEKVWPKIYEETLSLGGRPCGLDVLDITRIEAGFIMNGVDYHSSNHCIIENRKSNPYEIGLGWSVNLNRDVFVGQASLKKFKKSGSSYKTVGIEYNWEEYEKLFSKLGLPPELCTQAWRTSIPIYNMHRHQIGYATSGTWSPVLKKNIAIATIISEYSSKDVKIEVTVEHERKMVSATIVDMPFFNPERKKL